MYLRLFGLVFVTVFLAELGDKTQLATVLYASHQTNPKLVVFAAAVLALAASSALAVLAGATLSSWMSPRLMSRLAGVGFIVVGIWTLARA